MTSRRASFNGTRTARLLAALRRNGRSAALVVAGSLLLPACAAFPSFAATRVPHAHHASVPSSGRAQAHVVHDDDLHASRSSGKASGHHDRHKEESSRREAPERSGHSSHASHSAASAHPSASAHRNVETSQHARDSEDTRRAAKAPAKTRGSRRHHEVEPIDDPQPVHRADNRHSKYPAKHEAHPEQASHKDLPKPAHGATRADSRQSRTDFAPEEHNEHAAAPSYGAPATLPVLNGTPGNVARNMARRTKGHAASAPITSDPQTSDSPAGNPTGISQPEDDERLPARSAAQPPALSATARKQAAASVVFAHPQASLPTISAPSTQPSQSGSEPVEGFGGEVDFRTPAIQLANRPTPMTPIAPPHGTPSEQALELREAADIASKPMFVPLYNREGKLVVPPPLKGSRDILVHQNQMADDAGLSRIQDDADLARMRRAHLLVDLEESASLRVNEGLPENRRAARPWAVRFANDTAHAFYAHFGQALQVNSAVRTVAYQLRLQRTNGNAAAVEGEGASPHLTGQALDFGKRGMSVAQIAWMRSYLLPLIDAGKIDVEEEFQQACFHVSVYASYMPVRKHLPTRTELAQAARTTHTRTVAGAELDDNMR